jgi:hypothetical protein
MRKREKKGRDIKEEGMREEEMIEAGEKRRDKKTQSEKDKKKMGGRRKAPD